MTEYQKAEKAIKNSGLTFDPKSHTYLFEGKKLTSASTLASQFSHPFDEQQYKKSAIKYDVDPYQLKKIWSNKAEIAAKRGTFIHEWIEYFLEHKKEKSDFSFDQITMFKEFYDKKLHKAETVAQECMVFSKRFGIAGTFDALLQIYGRYVVFDWKTNFELKTDDNCTFKKMKEPFGHLWDNDVSKYSVQISLYRLMLEEWGVYSPSGYIFWMGNDDSKLIKAYDLKDLLKEHLTKNLLI